MGGDTTGLRRALEFTRYVIAGLIVATLVAGLVYAFPRLQELQGRTAQSAGAAAADPGDAAAAADAAARSAVRFSQQVRAPRGYTGSGSGYAFSAIPPQGVDSGPGRWCADTTIGYRIDFTGALRAGSSQSQERYRWRKAFDQWTDASGGRYRFQYRGPAHYPVVSDADGAAPVDTASIPHGEIALTYAVGTDRATAGWDDYSHAGLSDALGLAGVSEVSWRDGSGIISRGVVLLDAVDVANDPQDLPTPYVHEAGHALGLAHVDDTSQIMATTAGMSARIGAGDRAGITRLAKSAC